MVRVELISIGDELLIGQTINTNASWMGAELSGIGYKVSHVATVSDTREAIWNALESALGRSEVILLTGGLGPTKDDITKKVLCEFFNSELIIDENVLRHVESFFAKRNRPMLEVNRLQASVPEKATVLFNEVGTAPGMMFGHNGRIIVSMPGVPYEMKYIFSTHVLPGIIQKFGRKSIYQRTILTQGIGESFLADQMSDWEKRIENDGLAIAYLPSPGMVKIRLTSDNGVSDSKMIRAYFDELKTEMPKHVYGEENETLTEIIGKLLKESGQTVGTVESCTAGLLASNIASVSGASDYLMGSLITYSNDLKKQLAGVSEESLNHFGAVSQQVVEQMAVNGRKRLGVDWCIATSGVAGPAGGMEEKPVGTIWIAISSEKTLTSQRFLFGDNRERNMQMTVSTSLNLLRCKLLGIIQ